MRNIFDLWLICHIFFYHVPSSHIFPLSSHDGSMFSRFYLWCFPWFSYDVPMIFPWCSHDFLCFFQSFHSFSSSSLLNSSFLAALRTQARVAGRPPGLALLPSPQEGLQTEDLQGRNWLVVNGGHFLNFPINIGLRLSSQLTNSYFSEVWPNHQPGKKEMEKWWSYEIWMEHNSSFTMFYLWKKCWSNGMLMERWAFHGIWMVI